MRVMGRRGTLGMQHSWVPAAGRGTKKLHHCRAQRRAEQSPPPSSATFITRLVLQEQGRGGITAKPGQADGAKKHHGKIFNSHQTRTLAVSEPAPPAALEQPHPQGLQHLGAFPRDKGVAQQEKSALSELSARYQRWISQLAETRWFQDQQQFWLCMESPGRRG